MFFCESAIRTDINQVNLRYAQAMLLRCDYNLYGWASIQTLHTADFGWYDEHEIKVFEHKFKTGISPFHRNCHDNGVDYSRKSLR